MTQNYDVSIRTDTTLTTLIESVRARATDFGLDPKLVEAVMRVESGCDQYAVRFEPQFKYILNPEHYAKINRITILTETMLQKMSIGLLQCMGAVARELGHEASLLELTEVDVGLYFGCMKLKQCLDKWKDEKLALSAYNAGSPRYVNGILVNQEYINRVLSFIRA